MYTRRKVAPPLLRATGDVFNSILTNDLVGILTYEIDFTVKKEVSHAHHEEICRYKEYIGAGQKDGLLFQTILLGVLVGVFLGATRSDLCVSNRCANLIGLVLPDHLLHVSHDFEGGPTYEHRLHKIDSVKQEPLVTFRI